MPFLKSDWCADMKTRFNTAKKCMFYGLAGIIFWVGPIIYFFYRRSKYDLGSSELHYMIAAGLLSIGLFFYGSILYTLKAVKVRL